MYDRKEINLYEFTGNGSCPNEPRLSCDGLRIGLGYRNEPVGRVPWLSIHDDDLGISVHASGAAYEAFEQLRQKQAGPEEVRLLWWQMLVRLIEQRPSLLTWLLLRMARTGYVRGYQQHQQELQVLLGVQRVPFLPDPELPEDLQFPEEKPAPVAKA